ncbi:MAG: hypothetical protein U5L96_20990 [Owenweeksia sp.]|nr:hypothetical protein [Owenweeksia sp.]
MTACYCKKIIKELIPASPEPDSLQASLILESKKLFAAETDLFNTWQYAAIQFADTITPDSAQAEFIFNEAYEIADNYNSTNAQKAARALAKKAYTLRSHFRYKMLEAYMAYLMEDFNQAENLVKHRIGPS